MSIEELRAIVSPPERPVSVPTESDWSTYRDRLGLPFPSEYREVVDTYGMGKFSRPECPQLEIYQPIRRTGLAENDHDRAELALEFDTEMDDPEYQLHPARPGLVPFGSHTSEGSFFWLTDGEPNEWPIVVLRDEYFERHNCGGVIDFLLKVFRGEFESDVLHPEDFRTATEPVQFVPHGGPQ